MQPVPLVNARDQALDAGSVRRASGIDGRRVVLRGHNSIIGRREVLLQGLQFLPGLEAHGLSRWNGNFGAGPGISPNPRFARLDIEDAKAAQFDAISLLQGLFHGFENGFDRHFGFCFRYAGFIDDFVNDIQLDQFSLLEIAGEIPRATFNHMIGLDLLESQAIIRGLTPKSSGKIPSPRNCCFA